jgi:ArsR family transcriptional regulator
LTKSPSPRSFHLHPPEACTAAWFWFYQRSNKFRGMMGDVVPAKSAPPAISPLAGQPIKRADAERLAGVLKAFADPARLRVLSLIQSAPDGEASVSDLTAPLGLSQPTVSHHLRILTEAGLLQREKRGVWAYYRLVPSAIAAIADLLTPPRKRATKKAAR